MPRPHVSAAARMPSAGDRLTDVTDLCGDVVRKQNTWGSAMGSKHNISAKRRAIRNWFAALAVALVSPWGGARLVFGLIGRNSAIMNWGPVISSVRASFATSRSATNWGCAKVRSFFADLMPSAGKRSSSMKGAFARDITARPRLLRLPLARSRQPAEVL
jgi:hypothetical protein